jgi:hypothetical protein
MASMNKLCIALTLTLLLAGSAHAQLRSGDPAYAVEGLVLGSKLKFDSAAYRDYKCTPSEQFDAFAWCQKSRRDRERRGPFDATYSVLHGKDGTVVYANRHQQPAFFDAGEADRDIQNYSRKLGEPARVTKMPRRSGTTDAVMAVWGNVELEPLDEDSIRTLAQGRSPRKGLLIDFISDFTRSAQEGLPIYRILGGAGFVWAASFDQRGRGTLRFAAVDASALQPALAVAQPPSPARDTTPQDNAPLINAPQSNVPQSNVPQGNVPQDTASRGGTPQDNPPRDSAPLSNAPQGGAPRDSALRDNTPQVNVQPPPPAQPELAAAVSARKEAEATVARLQAELSTAVTARSEAELARAQAEAAAREARTDAEIAHKEFREARDYAIAAKNEIDRLRTNGETPASDIKGVVLIGVAAAAILFFLISVLSRMLSSAPKHPEGTERTAASVEVPMDEAPRAVPEPISSESSPTTVSVIHQEDMVKKLAMTLGVQEPAIPLPGGAPPVADDGERPDPAEPVDFGERSIEQQEQTHASASSGETSISPEKAPDAPALVSASEDPREPLKSIVADAAHSGEVAPVKPD